MSSLVAELAHRPHRAQGWTHYRDDGSKQFHAASCPCVSCAYADACESPPRPTFALRTVGKIWPDIDWLAWLPPAERRWYAERSEWLVRRFPDIPEEAWLRLFR